MGGLRGCGLLVAGTSTSLNAPSPAIKLPEVIIAASDAQLSPWGNPLTWSQETLWWLQSHWTKAASVVCWSTGPSGAEKAWEDGGFQADRFPPFCVSVEPLGKTDLLCLGGRGTGTGPPFPPVVGAALSCGCAIALHHSSDMVMIAAAPTAPFLLCQLHWSPRQVHYSLLKANDASLFLQDVKHFPFCL